MRAKAGIFITGGGSGIGRATALLFAGRGWRVGLADVDAAALATTRALLRDAATETYVMDVRDRDAWADSLDAFVDGSGDGGGRLDVLFNNAGVGSGGPLAETPFDEIDRVVGINLTGAINGARIGHAYLRRTARAYGSACLLNTASASAIYGSAGLATYSATKFGVRALTEALDGEWAADGIRVRAILPGFIDTPLLDARVIARDGSIRETVRDVGLEITDVDVVAQAAWTAVHGKALHTYVGRTARRMAFAARWMPGRLRAVMRR